MNGSQTKSTIGFGVPDSLFPHQFIVRIPKSVHDRVLILEDFGLNSPNMDAKPVERMSIGYDAWKAIQEPLQNHFNQRLAELNKKHADINFKRGKFTHKDNFIERLFGQELCVLGWAIERADPEDARVAFDTWMKYSPQDRRWMQQQIAQDCLRNIGQSAGSREAIKRIMIAKPDKAFASPPVYAEDA